MSKQYQKQKLKWKEQGRQEMIKEVLEYLSQRGFRESNYEVIELTKWLMSEKDTNGK